MSRATLPAAPLATPSVHARCANRSRWACQGVAAACRSSRAASASVTARPCAPRAARVPAAPPSCNTRARSRAVSTCRRVPAERVGPSRRFQSERDRRRLLQPGAARHRGLGIAAREAGRGMLGAAEMAGDGRHRGSKLQHETGVQDVLARCAPVHVAARRQGRWRATRAVRCRTTGMTAFPSPAVSSAIRARSYRSASRRRPDRCDAGGGHDARRRLGLGQRRLDVQHRLQLRPAVEPSQEVRIAEQAGMQASIGGHDGSWGRRLVARGSAGGSPVSVERECRHGILSARGGAP